MATKSQSTTPLSRLFRLGLDFGFRSNPARRASQFDRSKFHRCRNRGGHRVALIESLDLLQRKEVAALDPARYGLADPTQKYDINGIVWTHPVGSHANVREDTSTRPLRAIYVGRIAYEYMHSPSKTERLWFSHLLESDTPDVHERRLGEKSRIHALLARSETFDYRNREHHIRHAPPRQIELLTGLLKYSPAALFHKIKGGSEVPEGLGAAGDVISHLVASTSLQDDGASKPVKVTLLPNPSHLAEAVNPVALGKTHAKQFSLLKALLREGETDL
ncbi:putative 2-oxoglutarate dehydrogenase E1 component DHKTD1, mitochondrial [Grifola frondosa]|uniref:Putative 2-oxoglutarate dehydrogenase E1 component DHKTD1, mitochondrial n=1 Tax=Grifola frondosa TaxID=5627 RepID=A0A1C7LNK8_GRIFR|nr:putative 2-oxoglutarate dehydrogenase E1 component DHKTD1, mitochondrial [Grifola frondosa]